MSTVNGIGTKFYGSAKVERDGSYIATKWIVFLYLPVYPLHSFRVLKQSSANYIVYNTQRLKIMPVKLNTKQVVKTYALVYGIIALIILLVAIFG